MKKHGICKVFRTRPSQGQEGTQRHGRQGRSDPVDEADVQRQS